MDTSCAVAASQVADLTFSVSFGHRNTLWRGCLHENAHGVLMHRNRTRAIKQPRQRRQSGQLVVDTENKRDEITFDRKQGCAVVVLWRC